MHTTPMAATLARDAIASQLIGTHGTDPVIPYVESVKAPPRIARSRKRLAALLRRAAEVVGPVEQSPAC